ncbi:hypothetical protein K435DRAFT_208620 [Dendrothele bispora CBS 962.96]|uniref:Uncharacterized protein n=1 Tax=Dendrothele bispora (strain CBS 962.96) TaxID=1314807 RepID=A0A4S8LU38_DENBC|nr:hypothetical protein K435DRAFT_208620 [Dendrothele bispora CBS 962.96]
MQKFTFNTTQRSSKYFGFRCRRLSSDVTCIKLRSAQLLAIVFASVLNWLPSFSRFTVCLACQRTRGAAVLIRSGNRRRSLLTKISNN